MKKLTAWILAAVMLCSMTACSLVSVNEEKDLDSVVAVVCGEQITKRMVMNEWNRDKESMGVTEAYEQTEDGQRIIKTVLQNLLTDMVKSVIRRHQAEALGLYPLSDENYQKMLDRADAIYEERLSDVQEQLIAEYEQAGSETEHDVAADAKAAVELMMTEQFEYSREMDLRHAEEEIIRELLVEYYGASVQADDAALQAYYEDLLARQKEPYTEDSNNFLKALKDEELILYYPGQAVRVKQILIGFDEDVQANIASLRSAGNDDKADALRKESIPSISDEAEEALDRAQNGENFDELIIQYGDDTGMMLQSQREEGYLVGRDSTDFIEEFTAASLALKKDGEVSGLVLSDYGYHIIYAINVYDEKTVPLAEVQEELTAQMLETEKGQLYTAAMDELYAQTDVEYYMKRLVRGNISTVGYDNALLVEPYRLDAEVK